MQAGTRCKGCIQEDRLKIIESIGRSTGVLRLNSTAASFYILDEVIKDDERFQRIILAIEYDVLLPAVSDKRLRKYQSNAEARKNMVYFTGAIYQLFNRIRTWPLQRDTGGIRLTVTATSLSDDLDVGRRTVTPLHKRNAYKYIKFDQDVLETTQKLPSVRCITSLDWDNFDRRTTHCSWRRLHPTTISAMTAALPCLEQSYWHIVMPPRRLSPLRREIRSALAEALNNLPYRTPALKNLDIFLEDCHPMNERAQVEKYVESGEQDPLSRGVWNVCQMPNLVRVYFRGSWILSGAAFDGAELGPKLEYLLVELALTTPDGRWHFDEIDSEDQESEMEDSEPEYYEEYGVELQPRELPDINSEDSDQEDPELPDKAVRIANLDVPMTQIRGLPNEKTLVPLLSTFAEAVYDTATSMESTPAIKAAEVRLHAPNTMAYANLGFFVAGVVPENVFSGQTQVTPAKMKESLTTSTWRWAAKGPYGAWEIPKEVRRWLHVKVDDNT